MVYRPDCIRGRLRGVTIVCMSVRQELSSVWPQFSLQIDVDGARLEAPTDAQLEVLARLAGRPEEILEPDKTHFVKWMEGRTPLRSSSSGQRGCSPIATSPDDLAGHWISRWWRMANR